MKKFIKLEKNKLFISLTFILIISIFVIIRENSYKLIWENRITMLIFVPNYTEKIFYNIAISYVAAYLFYLIQIYIPATLKNKNAIKFLRESIIKEIEIIKYILFIVLQTTVVKNDKCKVIKIPNRKIYILVEKSNTKYLRRYTFGYNNSLTCTKLLELAKNQMDKIVNNYFFHDLDPYIASCFFKQDLSDFFSIFEQINKAYEDHNQYALIDNQIIDEIKMHIEAIEKLDSSFVTVNFKICDNFNFLKKYDRQWAAIQDEFMLTININNLNEEDDNYTLQKIT